MSEQREALSEALLPLYRTAVDDRHDISDCLCGGECFRESDLRVGAAEWADRVLASPALARLLADAEQRGAARVTAALTAVHERYFDLDGRPGVDDTTPEPEDVWRYDRDFRAALTPAAAQDPA